MFVTGHVTTGTLFSLILMICNVLFTLTLDGWWQCWISTWKFTMIAPMMGKPVKFWLVMPFFYVPLVMCAGEQMYWVCSEPSQPTAPCIDEDENIWTKLHSFIGVQCIWYWTFLFVELWHYKHLAVLQLHAGEGVVARVVLDDLYLMHITNSAGHVYRSLIAWLE